MQAPDRLGDGNLCCMLHMLVSLFEVLLLPSIFLSWVRTLKVWYMISTAGRLPRPVSSFKKVGFFTCFEYPGKCYLHPQHVQLC